MEGERVVGLSEITGEAGAAGGAGASTSDKRNPFIIPFIIKIPLERATITSWWNHIVGLK